MEGLSPEAAQKVRNAVTELVPQVQTESDGERFLATLIQYGAPAMGAAKIAQAAFTDSPKLARWAATLGAASASDAVVSNPDKAETVGDLIGGPTDIQADDSRLEKRAKVGAEAGAIGGALDSVMKLVGAAKRWAAGRIGTGFNAEDDAAKVLQESVVAPYDDVAIKRNIEDRLRTDNPDIYKDGDKRLKQVELEWQQWKDDKIKEVADRLDPNTKTQTDDAFAGMFNKKPKDISKPVDAKFKDIKEAEANPDVLRLPSYSVDNTTAPTKAGDNIIDAEFDEIAQPRAIPDSGYKPTSGTRSDNLGMLAIERGLLGQNSNGAGLKLTQRYTDN